MSKELKSLAKPAVLLPPRDRAYLAEQLLASLDETELEQQWTAEVKRRPGRNLIWPGEAYSCRRSLSPY